jgi:signal transduction histidine kinase/ActR/RegA family two-component response regulator
MMHGEDEEEQLRKVALQNAQSILLVRRRAEQELLLITEELEEEKRVLEILNKTGAALASKLELQALVQTVTDAATELTGAQFGAFFYSVSDTKGDSFMLHALSGTPREAFEDRGEPLPTPSFALTFRGGGVLRIADVSKDPRYSQMGPHHGIPQGQLPVRSYLAIPVTARSGEVIGGLFFGHPESDVFTERSERLVVGIAAQAANAIDNARLYEAAKAAAEERSRLLDAERQARSEVERVSLIKDEFLATLSHELRTPLNAVLGWSEYLLTRTAENTDTRRALETIVRNARAQAQLIEDLLDMNLIVSGKIRLDVQRVDLVPIVEAALDSVRPSANAKAIVLRSTVDPNSGAVFGDPNRLQQVLWNLLSNAVKFTPKGGRIDVLVQRVNSHAEITVQDTGIGISPGFLPHLFERFRQADSSSIRKYGGLGLGLSIVKQLVELHGGGVRAESRGEGCGASFVVSLPLRAVLESNGSARTHPTSQSVLSQRAPGVSLSGIRVLLIDDEPDARDLLRSVLTGVGAEVLTAASADEGFVCAKAERPDVIVSDIGMPERDGYEFIRDVRGLSRAEGGKTPAIALTAFARSEDRTRAMLAGYQVHVSKPIEPVELIATIKSLAGNRLDRGE